MRLLVVEDTSSSSAVQISSSTPTENFDSFDWHTISQMLYFYTWLDAEEQKSPSFVRFSQLLDVLLFVCLMSLIVFTASAVRFFPFKQEERKFPEYDPV